MYVTVMLMKFKCFAGKSYKMPNLNRSTFRRQGGEATDVTEIYRHRVK